MAYKIYTYVDPYRISETDFWEEIRKYPHLCASRTLVNGLIDVMGADIDGLICPIDELAKKRIYSSWSMDISRQIQQYSYLTSVYKRLYDKGKFGEDFYMSLTHNKTSMLEALRLFLELDIGSASLQVSKFKMEHRVFVYLLKLIEKREDTLFKLPCFPTKTKMIEEFRQQAQREKEEYKRRVEDKSELGNNKKRIEMYERIIGNMDGWDGKNVVIHGIHQFTPIQLRFIRALDKLGVEVIFLYNYISDYQEIYSSWNYIYQQFNAPVHHDSNITHYNVKGQLQNPGNALAANVALLCEGMSYASSKMRDNYTLYKDIKIEVFDTVSEYAGYVSDKFEDAKKKLEDGELLYQRPLQKRQSTAEVLRLMDEIVYTANKDVDELLQIYHPEYARNRHFLAYPIGQFFLALYNIWNGETGEINIDFSSIRTCMNSGILSKYNAEVLLKCVLNLEVIFENVATFTEFRYRMKKYLRNYDVVSNAKPEASIFPLKMMEIYNCYKVTKDDGEKLLEAVTEINEIAVALFSSEKDREDYIKFKDHFKRLEEIIRERQTSIANEEEKDLIDQLLIKLESVKPETEKINGTLEDLRNGLYFFLKQKEEPDSNWFVKNFEQIDGDILKSKGQNQPGKSKTYHFACVSNRDMNCNRNELLPWPLTEQFIESAYTPKDMQFQVYYASIGERSNFLRYALFYGLYFNQCETKLSYVKRYGDEVTEEYDFLKLLGVEENFKFIDNPQSQDYSLITRVQALPVNSLQYNKEEVETVFLCPYRFLMDYVLNPYPIESGIFLLEKLYENVLVENVWKRLEGQEIAMAKRQAPMIFRQEAAVLSQYFPFLRDTEIYDISKRAKNYFINRVLDWPKMGRTLKKVQKDHMSIRERFGKAIFTEKLSEHPNGHFLEEFEKLVTIKDDKREYSLNMINSKMDKKLLDGIIQYLNGKEDGLLPGEWCIYCPDKGICLQSFME